MGLDFAHPSQIFACVCAAGLFLVCLSGEAWGQGSSGEAAAQYFAPPPLRYVPADERAQLAAARDRRGRTRLGLELADARIERAEQSTAANRHGEAVAQLGIYQALIEDTLRFLRDEERASHRVRDLYRRVEQTLRAYTLRIEAMRRITPAAHATNIQTIIEFTQDARTGALNSFFNGAFSGDSSNFSNPSDPSNNAPERSPANESRERAPSAPL